MKNVICLKIFRKYHSNNMIKSLKPFLNSNFFIYIYFFMYKKERLQKKARERYQDLSEKEKNKKQQYGCKRYKNLPEDEE